MILPLEQLVERVARFGIGPLYSHSGRLAFDRHLALQRRCLLAEPDPTIDARWQSVCRLLDGTLAVAQATAGHLAECGLSPLYLLPAVHWEHELLDHCPQLWRQVLPLCGVAPDDPQLTGGNALVLQAGQVPLAQVLDLLLTGLTQADVMLLGDAPLIVKVHHHRQVWFVSPEPAWLPPLLEAENL